MPSRCTSTCRIARRWRNPSSFEGSAKFSCTWDAPRRPGKQWTRAWRIAERVLGPDHSSTLTIRTRLASALRSQGRIREAIQIFEEALAGLRRSPLPSTHPEIVGVLHGLGQSLSLAGRHADAEGRFTEALNAAKKIYGDEGENIARILLSLSNAQADSGRRKEAQETLRRAMDMTASIHGERSLAWLTALISLGTHAMQDGHGR